MEILHGLLGRRGSNPLRSQCLHLQELVNDGLGASNFLPECTHDMVWYTMVKTTKKKFV